MRTKKKTIQHRNRVTQRRKRKHKRNKRKVYTLKHYKSGDGMLTSVWGPSIWHFLHTMSFNYPIHPSKKDKMHYRDFIIQLQHVLPCRYCRENYKKNLKILPLTRRHLKSRASFSRYIFMLHELINKMLGKKSGLKYCDIRERYEHFRSRCSQESTRKQRSIERRIAKSAKNAKRTQKKERGCTEPLYGKKSKCIIKIVPQDTKCSTFQMDKRCVKRIDK